MKIKNILAIGLLSISAALISPSFQVYAAPMPATIHDRVQKTQISTGVIHERIERFTVAGWYNINILRVDLQDQYTYLGSLFHKDGLSSRTTVRGLVEQRNAVAGINGDFYNTNPIPTSLGALIDNGRIISSPNSLPTFFTTNDKSAYIDYFNRNMTITNYSTGFSLNIDTVNKLHQDFVTVTLLDSSWGTKSIGARFRSDLHEVLVVNGVVVERRTGGEAFDIPKGDDSFVLTSKSSNLLAFNPGDRIQVDISISPDAGKINFAIGSGSMVLREGQVTNSDINISGVHPRTGLGVSRDQKQVIMVTVDGRDTYFKGTTQETLGSLLLELGAYNGVNLDGGGSTAMAVKPVGQASAEFVNKPTEQRNVVNGIGVFSTAPRGNLDRMSLSANDTNLFPGSSTSLQLKGYDSFNNLYQLEGQAVQWSVSGGIGRVEGGRFIASSPGTGEITASFNGVSASTGVRVLGPAHEIRTEVQSISLSPGATRNLGSILGVDSEGRQAPLQFSQVKFQATGDIGLVRDGVFTAASKPASGAIVISSGNASRSIPVSVGTMETLVSSFENGVNISFSGYPAQVKGSASFTSEAFKGDRAIEINYDFTEGTGTRAAYLNFTNTQKGLSLPGSPQKLGMDVLGDGSGTWLRGTVLDARGSAHVIDFSKSIDFTGWKYLEAQIPANVAYPLTLQRIYVAEVSQEKFPKGRIVVDELRSFSTLPADLSSVPASTRIQDPLMKPADGASTKVAVYSEPKIAGNTLMAKVVSSHRLKGLTEALSGSRIGVQVGDMSPAFKNAVKHTTAVNGGSSYGTAQADGVYVVNIQAFADGIRAADSSQWTRLVNDLKNRTENNLIISISRPVFGQNGFNDKMEAELFHELLVAQRESGKNVFVVQSGGENSHTLRDGVRYITLTGATVTTPDDFSRYSYVEFAINGQNATYQIVTPYKMK